MARHIMAVCVVCLLCADHLPCQQHVETLFPAQNLNTEYTQLNAVVYNANDLSSSHASKTQSSETTVAYATSSSDNRRRRRTKRHSGDHGHDHDEHDSHTRPEITEAFLKRIFNEFGSGNDTIHVHDFQRMLNKLGLHQLLPQNLHKHDDNINDNETCIADSKLVHYIKPHSPPLHDHHNNNNNHHNHSNDHHHHHHHHHDGSEEISTNCTNVAEGCTQANTSEHINKDDNEHLNYALNQEDIVNVCPILLYQLSSSINPANPGCISKELLLEIDEHELKQFQQNNEDILWVWIYAFSAVLACSILGLVGVAIIPFMNSRFYKHIIQFLVSLAVGTMTGDALLHLLPHSLAGQNESNMIFKGLTCMGGIIFFYITEHGLTMISEWRKSVAKKEANQPSRAKVMRDPDSSLNNSVAGDKVCKSKYSSYPYCYDDIAMDTKNDVWLHLPNKTLENVENNGRNGKVDTESGDNATQSLLSTSQNNYAPLAERNHNQHNHNHNDHQQQQQTQQQQQQHQHQHGHCEPMPENNTVATDLDGNIVGDGAINTVTGATNGKDLANDNTVTVILREHESSHHGHSHKHGHVHSPPESLSAVVWMIIMGDGLHNFTDGMAIGAAFAENMAGGFSTALAVFCHELPHELGDFAILMKAGMSVKSAVYYNLLTGVLSFIGMIFGIVFGQSHETAQWMFAAAAGLFIYIAMVDMMPEISAAHKSLQQFALQILGMASGVLLMLLIAIYEDDLRNVFSTA
ncbi:zinc transporter foi [Calliphora vicina]|uniref:zinc transporter foi n=1 Tax=Calliphora vicina TaxID=7373 RepID=UPI00325AA4DB